MAGYLHSVIRLYSYFISQLLLIKRDLSQTFLASFWCIAKYSYTAILLPFA